MASNDKEDSQTQEFVVEGQHLTDLSRIQNPTNLQQERVEQVAISPRSGEQTQLRVIPNYITLNNQEIIGVSTCIYQKTDNQNDQYNEKYENLFKRQLKIGKTNKKLLEENKNLQEKVREHDSILEEIKKKQKKFDEHESLFAAIKKDDAKRDAKISKQERELKKAVQDEKKRAENFHKEFEDVSKELGRNKKAIEIIHTEVEQMSQESKKLSDQINERFDQVQAHQTSSDNRLFDKLDALEERQMRRFSEIESKQHETFEMIRILKAMRNARTGSDRGRFHASSVTEENESEHIPEQYQSRGEDTLDEDIEIFGQQNDSGSGSQETLITSQSNQKVIRRHRPRPFYTH